MSATIRIDPDVYERLLAVKHQIEKDQGEIVSMSDAIAVVLDFAGD